MQKEGSVFNLLKATRIKRTLTILTIILIPTAYTDKFITELFVLAAIIILIYSASSIYNAYKDKDYKLPKYSKKIIFVLILIALILALINKIILIISILAIILGFIYNTIARKIILGDSLIAGLTHFVLPFITSSLILEIKTSEIILPSIILYSLTFCIGPITNLKDIKEDKKRNYKTLVNSIKNPYSQAGIIFEMSLIPIIFLYLIFQISNILIFLIPIFILKILITNKIYTKKPKQALDLLRLYLITTFLILIFNLTTNSKIIVAGISIISIYLITLIFRKK